VNGDQAGGAPRICMVPLAAKTCLERLGVASASAESVMDAIVRQHWIGCFGHLDEVWYGLSFVKQRLPAVLRLRVQDAQDSPLVSRTPRCAQGTHALGAVGAQAQGARRSVGKREPLYMRGISEPADTLRELRAALCIPTAAGTLRSAAQLCARGILGVECSRCFATSWPSAEPHPSAVEESACAGPDGKGSHACSACQKLPIRLVPVDDQAGTVQVTSFLSGGSAQGLRQTYKVNGWGSHPGSGSCELDAQSRNGRRRRAAARSGSTCSAKHMCVASAGVSRGCFLFEVSISSKTLWASAGIVAMDCGGVDRNDARQWGQRQGGEQNAMVEAKATSVLAPSYFGLSSDGVLHR
jgi:hypothetical protein